jgi:hypothetical protein
VCHEDIGGRKRKAPFILNLDSDGVSVSNFKLRPIHPLPKTPYYPTNRKVWWVFRNILEILGKKKSPDRNP